MFHHKTRKFGLLALSLATTLMAFGQDETIRLQSNRLTCKQTIQLIEEQTDYSVVYSNSKLNLNTPVRVKGHEMRMGDLLTAALKGQKMRYEIRNKHIIISDATADAATNGQTHSTNSTQQTKKVSGRVVDSKGEPLIGAAVKVKGSSAATVTDLEGNFTLNNVAANATLEVTYIGYTAQAVEAKGGAPLNIVMNEDAQSLDELVVVGYGTQKKSSLTASISTVKSSDLAKQVTTNVASALQGRAPGVEILQNGGEAGGDVSILIRGAGSFGSTEPLYVIDGAFSNNGLNSLNSKDIESIEILKDGSAAAIYGSRAANGVVLITTKSGRAGKTKVELSSDFSYQTPMHMLDFMNSSQWRQFATTVANNSPAYEVAKENASPTNPNADIDWQDLYYRNASMYSFGASVSGGGEHSTFSTSLGYQDQTGIIIQSDYKKYNGRINGTYQKGRFTVAENLAVAFTKKQTPPTSRPIEIPTVPVTDSYGRYISTPAELGYATTNIDIDNSLAQIYNRNQWTKKTDITGSVSVKYDILKGLAYKIGFAGSYLNAHGYTHTPAYASYWDVNGVADSRFSQPYTSLAESRNEQFNYTIDNLLTYNKELGGHTFDALLGTSWMQEWNRTMSINSGTNDLGAASVTTYNGVGVVGSDEYDAALLSFFARLNYDYMNRYMLSLSVRSDKSSKFAKNHRTGWFPSVSAGWNVSEEKFFNIPWISKMKLRASYGILGANFITPYSFVSTAYGPVPTILNNKRQFGYVTRFAQSDLKWEKAISSNMGIEMGFLNNTLTFTGEYYYKRNNDLLAPLEALPSSGQTIVINNPDVPYYNSASVENKGWEFTLGYRNHWKDWSFDILGNITFMKNKVIKLGEGVQPIRGSLMSSKFNDRPTITKEGLPIGSFWGYKVAGINENGDFLYESVDGTSKTAKDIAETDKQVIGNPTPDFTYGLNINLGYKNWDLTMFLQGSHGNDIFAAAKYNFYFNYDSNCLVDALNSWTTTNSGSTLPIAKTDNYYGGNSLPSSFYVENGSYLRCKNIQLGYNFNEKLLQKTNFISACRIYVGVQNLFTITSYPLYDPEVSSNTLFDRGIDGLYRNAPRINARTWNFGINITL
uniref:TonB-dependent receptor n=1 Tax=Prevotella sp. GTC17253 TaxID=3236793 RepID=A0AB33IRH2_9BACT